MDRAVFSNCGLALTVFQAGYEYDFIFHVFALLQGRGIRVTWAPYSNSDTMEEDMLANASLVMGTPKGHSLWQRHPESVYCLPIGVEYQQLMFLLRDPKRLPPRFDLAAFARPFTPEVWLLSISVIFLGLLLHAVSDRISARMNGQPRSSRSSYIWTGIQFLAQEIPASKLSFILVFLSWLRLLLRTAYTGHIMAVLLPLPTDPHLPVANFAKLLLDRGFQFIGEEGESFLDDFGPHSPLARVELENGVFGVTHNRLLLPTLSTSEERLVLVTQTIKGPCALDGFHGLDLIGIVPVDGPKEFDTLCFSTSYGRRFTEELTRASLHAIETTDAQSHRYCPLLSPDPEVEFHYEHPVAMSAIRGPFLILAFGFLGAVLVLLVEYADLELRRKGRELVRFCELFLG